MATPRARPPAGRKPRKRLAPSEKYEIFVHCQTNGVKVRAGSWW